WTTAGQEWRSLTRSNNLAMGMVGIVVNHEWVRGLGIGASAAGLIAAVARDAWSKPPGNLGQSPRSCWPPSGRPSELRVVAGRLVPPDIGTRHRPPPPLGTSEGRSKKHSFPGYASRRLAWESVYLGRGGDRPGPVRRTLAFEPCPIRGMHVQKSVKKRLMVAVLVVTVGGILWNERHRLSIEDLAERQATLEQWRNEHPVSAFGASFATYAVATGLSLPV